jgi:hypothetical protein
MTNAMTAWDKIVGQERVRAHDGVSPIFRADKPEHDATQALPSNYYNYINGQTGFMREAVFYKSLLGYLDRLPQESFDILVVAGSVGCEAYSGAILKQMMGIQKNIRFHTTDIAQPYLDVAKAATYPASWVDGCPKKISPYFNRHANSDACTVRDDIRHSVIIRDAEDVRDIDAPQKFDVVVGMNFLMHVITKESSLYGMNKLSDIARERAAKSNRTRTEALKELMGPYYRDIDPILKNMMRLSHHLLCVNRLEDTPYFHSHRQAETDIFANNGFSKTMDADWHTKPSTDLEDNKTAGNYSRNRDYTQVLVRG